MSGRVSRVKELEELEGGKKWNKLNCTVLRLGKRLTTEKCSAHSRALFVNKSMNFASFAVWLCVCRKFPEQKCRRHLFVKWMNKIIYISIFIWARWCKWADSKEREKGAVPYIFRRNEDVFSKLKQTLGKFPCLWRTDTWILSFWNIADETGDGWWRMWRTLWKIFSSPSGWSEQHVQCTRWGRGYSP